MKTLATFIVSCFDLVEAEGRTLRTAVLRLGIAAALFAVATALGVAEFGLALWACHGWLSLVTSPPAAALLTGLLMLIIAGGLVWSGRRIAK